MRGMFDSDRLGRWVAVAATALFCFACVRGATPLGSERRESTANSDARTEAPGAEQAKAEAPALPANDEIQIVVGANRRSELEPCGCKANQQGGIDREAKLYNDLREKGIEPLILDAGGFVDQALNAMLKAPDPSRGENEVLKTRFMLQAMREAGYLALNVSASDYLYGEERLRSEANGMALLSANVRGPNESDLPFDPFRVYEIETPDGETIRVAVIGVSGAPPGGVPRKDVDATRVDVASPAPAPVAAAEAPKANGAAAASPSAAVPSATIPVATSDAPPKAVAPATASAPPAVPAVPAEKTSFSSSPRRIILTSDAKEEVRDPARPRRVEAAEIGPEVGGFEPARHEDYYYLFTRSFPAFQSLPRTSYRDMLPESERAIHDILSSLPAAPAADRPTTGTLAPSAPASPFVIPAGAFNTKELRSETAYETDSKAYPASKIPPAPKPRQTSEAAPFTAGMRWHRDAAKGDDAPAPAATTGETVVAPESTPAPRKATVRDITESDRDLRDALRAVREKLSAAATFGAYERMGEKVDIVDPRAALEAVMAEVRPKADYVIVLYGDTRQNIAPMVKGISGIDAMATSEANSRGSQFFDVEGIQSFNGGYEGRMNARLKTRRTESGDWVTSLDMLEVKSQADREVEITKILDAYKEEANKIVSTAPPVVAGPPTFIGDRACAECHGDIHVSWKTTPHATAIDTLVAVNAENNPDCNSCHVTGHKDFNDKGGGFHAMRTTPHLANVQCEVCHGPAWEHVTSMRRAAYYEKTNRLDMAKKIQAAANAKIVKSPTEETCLQCHVPKTGDFDFAERLPFVNHSQPYPEERREAHKAKQAMGADMFQMFSADPHHAAPVVDPAAPKGHSFAPEAVEDWLKAQGAEAPAAQVAQAK